MWFCSPGPPLLLVSAASQAKGCAEREKQLFGVLPPHGSGQNQTASQLCTWERACYKLNNHSEFSTTELTK